MESTTHMLSLLQLNAAETHKREITVSDSASHIDHKLLSQLMASIQEAHTAIETTSALPGFETNAETVETARKQVDQGIWNRIKHLTEVKESLLLKLLNLGIKAQQAGNCYEFSFFTQSILEKQHISSEIFRIKGVDNQNSHVFLVIKRDPNTKTDDFSAWNRDALIVDPYLKQIYSVSDIPKYLQSCAHSEETNTVRYIPFNRNEHKLDNNVQKEFVEDWQTVLAATKNQINKKASEDDASTSFQAKI